MKDHLPVLITVFPLAGAWLVLTLGFFSHRLSRWMTYGVLLFTLGMVCKTFPRLFSEGNWHYSLGGWAPPWGIELVVTPFTAFAACLILLTVLIAFFLLGLYGTIAGLLKSRENLGGPLLLVLMGSLLTLLFARDGFTLYLFLQIAIVAAAGLLLCVTRQGWLESFTFLLGGSAGASLLLVGIIFLYASTGTLHLDDALARLFIAKNFSMALAAGVFVSAACGFLFYFPVPFFFTRLLNLTPPFVLGLLSSVVVRTVFYLLFLFIFFVLNVPGITQPEGLVVLEYLLVFLFLAHFITAARQKDFLHSAAYLSVAQLGILFMGLILGSKSALTGTLMELLSQTLVVMGLFAAVGILSLKPAGAHPFSKLAGLGRHDFGVAMTLIVFVFSIVGIPPTGGFFGKFFLLQAVFERKDWFFLAALFLTAGLNLVSAGRFTWLLFEHRKAASFHAPISLSKKAPLFLLALAILLLGLFHQEVIHNFIEPSLPKAFLNSPVPNVPFLGKQVE